MPTGSAPNVALDLKAFVGSRNIFVIEYWPEGIDETCTLLHDEDSLSCTCGYGTTGKKFAATYAKKNNFVPCSHCKGTGVVKGKKA